MKRMESCLLLLACLWLCGLVLEGRAAAEDIFGIHGITWDETGTTVDLAALGDCTVVAALYRENGSLLDVQTKDVPTEGVSGEAKRITMPLRTDRAEVSAVKAFLVSKEGSVPLCPSCEVTPHIYAALEPEGEQECVLTFLASPPETGVLGQDYWEIIPDPEGWEPLPWTDSTWYMESRITSVDFRDPIAPVSTARWFEGCYGLTEVRHPENLRTDAVTDMHGMFNGCRALTALDVTKWNTSAVTDMSDLFYDCQSLTALDVTGWDTSGVTTMRNLFHFCGELTALDVTKWNTSAVTDMSGMFGGCEKLTALDVSGLETSAVTDMSGMFNGCQALERLDVSGFDTSAVTDMSGMFSVCGNLTTLELGDFQTGKVTNMRQMFWGDAKLVSLDLHSFNTAQVTDMLMMFTGCSRLRSLDLRSFNTTGVTNMEDMFQSCHLLSTIYVSDGFVTDNVENSQKMFGGCNVLTGGGGTTYREKQVEDASYARLDDPSRTPGYFTDGGVIDQIYVIFNSRESGTSLYIYKTLPTGYSEEEAHVWKVQPYDSADQCPWKDVKDRVEHVSVVGNVVPSSMAYWFTGCVNLQDISFFAASIDTSQVTDMRELFSGCGKLTELDLRTWDTSRVRDMTGMFSGCSALKKIYIDDPDIYGVGLFTADYAAGSGPVFTGCESLVGNSGTAYDSTRVSITYARMDNGGEYSGYFSSKNAD